MRRRLSQSLFAAALLPIAVAQSPAPPEPDRDGDGLSDFLEVHKYLTDPSKADTDGDGVPDGDWLERREHQYTVRTVVQVMRPVTIDYLNDDHQDARVLDETERYVELEVIHYPFTTIAKSIVADPNWRRTARKMSQWTRPGPTADWSPKMQRQLIKALKQAGIDANKLDDKELVEQASRWLCQHAKNQDCFTTFITAFDQRGKPFVPEELLELAGHDQASLDRQWPRDISARGMFEQGVRGSCSSSAIYLNGCLRALGIPTRTILTIPLVDANDDRELELVERGITHHELKQTLLPALQALKSSWASHTFNEVFVGGRWRRLNYHRLGQDIVDPGLFGMITHVATFSDWADARMPETIGRRQTKRHYGDLFGGPNPYSTIAVRDAFGPHCKIENPKPVANAPAVQATVTAVEWGLGQRVSADIRSWFQKRDAYGLVARVEGPKSFQEMKRFLGNTDLRVYLVCQGHETLGMGFDAGAWWWQGDHAWIVVPFGGADQQAHVPSKPYKFVCRNQGDGSHWQVDDGVRVPPRK